MIWFAILLSAAGWELHSGFYVAPDPGAAWRLWALAVVLLLAAYPPAAGRRRSPAAYGNTLGCVVVAGAVIVSVQFLFSLGYERLLVGAPTLDWLAPLIWLAATLLGYDAGIGEGLVHIQTQQQLFSFSLGPEKFGLPFIGLVLLPGAVLLYADTPSQRRFWQRLALLSGAALGYCVARLGLLVALFVDYEKLSVFWQPLWLVLQFLPLVLLLALLLPLRATAPVWLARWQPREAAYAGLLAALTLMLTVVGSYRPAGEKTDVRVLIDDAHSDWAWTDVVFDKFAFNRKATYSYTNLVEHLGRYYSVEVNRDQPLTAALLSGFDVVVLKTPTRPYAEAEIDAVERYVSDGGGLFLIGDHTNLFGMTTHMNPLAGRFGLRFEDDDTFDLASGQPSVLRNSPLNPHPIAQGLNGMAFETSCSVVAPLHADRVLVGYALGSELVDYSHINFFGNMAVDSHDRYGVFLQGAALDYGRGRVSAFTDSTIFSNFSVFQEGRAELALATVAYLQAGPSWHRAWWWLLLVLAVAALGLALRKRWVHASLRAGMPALALALPAGLLLVKLVHLQLYTPPEPRDPYPKLVFDRYFSQYELPSMIEVGGGLREKSFDAFFVATQRMGFVPRIRRDFVDALGEGYPFILINPVGAVYTRHAAAVSAYLRSGGSMLVMVDDKGPFHSLNALLNEVGVGIVPKLPGAGVGAGEVEVVGVEPVALPPEFAAAAGSVPAVYRTEFGRGRLVLVVGAQYLSQERMGPVFNNPDEAERALYLLEYHLIDDILLQNNAGETPAVGVLSP
ncbi:hypothetical protein FKG94_01060 [Exilibacterium tricleocarpae]|uniref:DUF4350 domain-containing protein n=1 Tax=Exilibacterium tricleocarpae TaxID=2591008 RepID=A0A545U9M6_9GAMM|nr:DUF4350 domain-containing protein [Exilibacterium tricleocarpae]TQV86174.1 hypothetical protein FKG94_01060 [Exilibacterium tricleocarpae]